MLLMRTSICPQQTEPTTSASWRGLRARDASSVIFVLCHSEVTCVLIKRSRYRCRRLELKSTGHGCRGSLKAGLAAMTFPRVRRSPLGTTHRRVFAIGIQIAYPCLFGRLLYIRYDWRPKIVSSCICIRENSAHPLAAMKSWHATCQAFHPYNSHI